jgi:hypothetical protein
MPDEEHHCAVCKRPVPLGMGYVARIDVFADPELPPMTSAQIEATDVSSTLLEVMEQIKNLSAEELQESVHRRFEFRLCPGCHRAYLANPLGMPRAVRVGAN